MNSRIKDAVLAAFVADALSLGVHWVYDTSAIDRKYGRLEKMVRPELVPYHKSKGKGEFTHYGDQMMVLLESVIQVSGFDLSHFSKMWKKMFLSYDGYMDHATKETLVNFAAGKGPDTSGSLSADLAGASRMAPLALVYGEDMEAFAAVAASQTAMTHNNKQVVKSAELLSVIAVRVLQGATPCQGIETALKMNSTDRQVHEMVQAGFESRFEDTRQVIAGFGQMCEVTAALPSTIHLIAKYEDDIKEGLIENAMAGGDSAARGILTGFILGCFQGLEMIPGHWLEDLAARDKILKLLENVH